MAPRPAKASTPTSSPASLSPPATRPATSRSHSGSSPPTAKASTPGTPADKRSASLGQYAPISTIFNGGMTLAEQLWGGETTKAVDNFPVSGERVPVPVVRWLGRIKVAAAEANGPLGILDEDLAWRIADAGRSIAEGEHHDQFPIDVFPTRSSTS